jgi:2,3-bisphosphoglycerate-independent phosphoglycerate mutase
MDEFPGRGLLEAVGGGLPFDDRDVLCIAHLFYAEPKFRSGPILYMESWKEAVANEEELAGLYEAITPLEVDGVLVRLHRLKGNEGVLLMKGDVSPYVSDSDPMSPGKPMGRIVPLAHNPEPEKSVGTAKALNAFLIHCRKILKSHSINKERVLKGLQPLNFLATQRCGRRIPIEPFYERWGMNGLVIASGPVFIGLASELGMDFEKVRRDGDPEKDLDEKVALALKDTVYDFIHVHTKAPDEAAHRGDPAEKAAVVEALDRGMRGLVERVESGEDILVVVTADHSTPCGSSLIHSGETVPLLMCGSRVRRDRVGGFDELRAAAGGLGLLQGSELMLTLLNASDRSALMGHRLGGKPRAYSSVTYDGFRDVEES